MMRRTRSVLIFVLWAGIAITAQDTAKSADGDTSRTPDITKLLSLIDEADRIVVVDTTNEKETQVFESTQEKDLKEFRNALSLAVPDEWFYSICGGPVIRLYRKDQQLVSIKNIISRSITTSLWEGDVLIADTERWLKWFDSRKLTQVRAEFARELANRKKIDEDEARWYAAMPRGLKEPFEKQVSLIGLPSMNDTSAFGLILQREYPNKKARILALLHWYGSGEGRWSGYPGYESIAENVLFMFKTTEILEALKSHQLSPTETEGAARLFAGWDYFKERPNDLKLIPREMKLQFLTHALKSSDEDKRSRAKAAFSK